MFPTTIWTTIRQAGHEDPDASQSFAELYRPAVLRYIQFRGFGGADAEDLVQDVFVRVLSSGVLRKADAAKGRFRSLLLRVVIRSIQDRLRRKSEVPKEDIEIADRDPDFDREWVLHLTDRAMTRLKEQGSPYYEVLKKHLNGESESRNKLWIARKKLVALIRDEVAYTCSSEEQFQDEIAYLSQFLRPLSKPNPNSPKKE